jgi:hypothetical protein
MHIDFEAKIMAVQFTLDADEVMNIANMYRADAEKGHGGRIPALGQVRLSKGRLVLPGRG